MTPVNDKFLNWDALEFFSSLTDTNRFAREFGFVCRGCSSLDGFYDLLSDVQSAAPIVAVSDISSGELSVNNHPKARRIKTVFLAMRHAIDDPDARTECMEILRELFRQFMSRLILERERIAQGCIYIDPDITFTEIDRYFFSGCACAYFQITVDTFTDLTFNPDEWTSN